MPQALACLGLVLALAGPLPAQTRKSASKKAPAPVVSRVQAEIACPSELGMGVATLRRYCDILTGRDPAEGVLVTIPAHRGPLQLSFDLHNRHTYSADLVKQKQAYRKYTATIGVLTMDNTLVERAVVLSEFRTEQDLFDRIAGGAGPGGVKAVAPSGAEPIVITLPAEVTGRVAILGEKLTVVRPDGVDTFLAPGRPVATISNVMLEFTPGPAPKKAPARKR